MFPKKHRLAKTTDVKKVFAQGRSFFNPFFTIRFKSRPDQATRFTVVVSTKVSKKAVDRNRIKRVIREFARLRLVMFMPGDYAILVKPAASKADNESLRQRFDVLVKNSRLMRI